MRQLSEPLTAGYLRQHLAASGGGHGFGEREACDLGTATWGALYVLHRGDHEGRDQDHMHEA